MSEKSEYAVLLNALCDMQSSPVYAVRRQALAEAELAIVDLEGQRDELLALMKQIIGACDACSKDDSTSIVDTFTQQMEDDARALILKIEDSK